MDRWDGQTHKRLLRQQWRCLHYIQNEIDFCYKRQREKLHARVYNHIVKFQK